MPLVILLAVDGSSHSLNAARYAAAIVTHAPKDFELRLMYVQYRIPPRPAAVVGREILAAYYRNESEDAIRAAKQLLDAAGLRYEVACRIGNPDTEIVRYAESEQVDLIVMGSHGHGAVKSLLLGSVAQGVMVASSAPVMVVREGATAPRNGEILVPVDGSAFSRRALAFLLRHRRLLAPHNPITLLHVAMPIGKAPFKLKKSDERRLLDDEHECAMKSARRLLTRAQAPWQEVQAQGNAGVEIAAYARRHNPGLIVMGSHGHGAMTGLLVGSVTQKTLGLCQAPMLIVK